MLSGWKASLGETGDRPRFPARLRDGDSMKALASALALALFLVWAVFSATAVDREAPSRPPAEAVRNGISSIGDASMGPLMDAWLSGLQKIHPDIRRGARWEHHTDAAAIGALMFEIAHMAAIAGEPWSAELAPYAHPFAGDMMKTPLLEQVALKDGRAAYIAVHN